jgi:PAS domain S-box-containing protein
MDDPTELLGGDRVRVESVLDSMSDLLWVLDSSFRLVAWNDELPPTLGYSETELQGQAISNLVPESHTEPIHRRIDSDTETPPDTVEVPLEPKDGPPIPHELQIDKLTDADGAVVGWVVVARDISERVEARQELELENQRLDEFASVLAHDLRTHLNVAKGYHHALAQEQSGTPHELTRIGDAHSRIERIIDDVLQLARTGDTATDLEQVSLAGVAETAWAEIERGTAELRIETELRVRADRSLLRRMLLNLFRNAIEHAGPAVRVRVDRLDARDGFYVADNGDGIPPEKRSRAFDWKHTTKADGFGIGLTSVAEVCRAHNWDIGIAESQAGGARFEINTVDVLDG